jgi:hypothetical protein
MKSTYVDAEGNVVCPVCGAKNNFTSKRTGKGKAAGIVTVGVGAVLLPKRLKCNGCGTNLKRGDVGQSAAAPVKLTARDRLVLTKRLTDSGMTLTEVKKALDEGVDLPELVRMREAGEV